MTWFSCHMFRKPSVLPHPSPIRHNQAHPTWGMLPQVLYYHNTRACGDLLFSFKCLTLILSTEI